jgi:glycosyltransferase involved in cell wall biosynthesis
MSTQPLVSVVIPVFNRGHSILHAIESVRAQTHENLEIIVVDDGSSDDTFAVVDAARAQEPRLRTIRHASNAGAQAARNTGIDAAAGTWIAFLDSDDTYLPGSVEQRMAAAFRGNAAVVHSECLVQKVNGTLEAFHTPPMRGDVRREILAGPGPTFPGMLIDANCLRAIGTLDASVVAYQEWDTAIRLSAIARFGYVEEPTFVYEQRGSDTISKDSRRSVAGYEQVVRKHAKAMLRNGGPRVLSGHLVEAAHQHAAAGDRWTALSRLLAAGALWPFSVRRLWHTAAKL